MSRTQALLPGDYANGARVVETTLRPVRPACLIPEDAPNLAARFAESRSLAWGGHVGFVFPFSRSEGLREPWQQIFDQLDPDQVFALGIPRPQRSSGVVNMHAPHREPPKPLVDRMGDDLGRLVYTAEDGPERLFISASTLIHSALDAVGQNLKPPDNEHYAIVPSAARRSPAYLPVVARYGSLDDKTLKEALDEVYSHRYQFHLDILESIEVREVAVRSVAELTGDLSGLLEGEEPERALTLPELTLRGMQITGTGKPLFSHRRSDSREKSRYPPIVVTGASDSVEDFALFWNLRSEHYFAKPFPLWLPLDFLEDSEAPAAIQAALKRFRPSVGETYPRMDDVSIVSASTSAEELQERLCSRYPEARIGTDDLSSLFTATCEYSYATEKTPAYFETGRASIRPLKPEEFKKNLIPRVDNVVYEVGVDGMWIPQSEAMAQHLGRMRWYGHDNITKRGNLRFVEQFNKESSSRDLLDIRTPDGWSVLSSVFGERGYDIEPTAKGSASLGQLALLGDVENLKVIASSGVRKLLQELSRRRGETRPYLDERKTLPFERFREVLGREAAGDILRWLVEHRVVFRGAVMGCPRCKMTAWYSIDRVQEVWRCDGCQEDSPIPLEMDRSTWRYRVNELYARGHDQGTLTPLLTLNAMHVAWGGWSTRGDIGFYPGIEITAKEGADVPFPHKEIDLVAMMGGTLIIAECKESAGHLAKPEKVSEFAQQLGDVVVLADHLEAARVLVASSTPFPEDKDQLVAEVPAEHSVDIRWLDSHDLLDPNVILHPLAHPTADGERIDKPEGWEDDYLEWVRTSVADQTI